MNKRQRERLARLLPNGVPHYIRCYDSGENGSFDRYTVVFTGNYTHKTGGEHWYVGMSEHPTHPQGFGQHGSSRDQIDRPNYGHIGKKIRFQDLPIDCQQLVLADYKDLWDLTEVGIVDGKMDIKDKE